MCQSLSCSKTFVQDCVANEMEPLFLDSQGLALRNEHAILVADF